MHNKSARYEAECTVHASNLLFPRHVPAMQLACLGSKNSSTTLRSLCHISLTAEQVAVSDMMG